MNVALLCPDFLPNIGGLQIVEHRQATELAAHPDCNVFVIIPWANWRQVRRWVPYRVLPIIDKSDRVNYRLRDYRALVALAEAQLAIYQSIYQFDVWHVHTAFPGGTFAADFLQKKNLPRLLTCHGYDVRRVPEINYGARLDPEVDRLVRRTLRQYPTIVAISKSIRQELQDCDVAPENIIDIPNGADVRRIQGWSVDREHIRGQLKIDASHKVLLSVGTNTPVKGFDLIPKIIVELLKQRDDFVWVLVGKGSDEVAQLAAKMGVDAYLRCLPAMGLEDNDKSFELPNDLLIQHYKASDLYVSTSRSEGFPGVLLEAMAAGLPLVSTDATGSRDIVNPSVGLISPVDDVADLASNILQVLNDSQAYATFKENALAYSCEFDWEIICQRYVQEYQSIIARH